MKLFIKASTFSWRINSQGAATPKRLPLFRALLMDCLFQHAHRRLEHIDSHIEAVTSLAHKIRKTSILQTYQLFSASLEILANVDILTFILTLFIPFFAKCLLANPLETADFTGTRFNILEPKFKKKVKLQCS